MGDLELLEQVMINLIKNAKEAYNQTNESYTNKILLTADCVDGFTTITVTDNGVGISKEMQENIFVPFYSTKKGGSGIRLALSRQIMRLHKGHLSCNSEEGKETSFTMRF